MLTAENITRKNSWILWAIMLAVVFFVFGFEFPRIFIFYFLNLLAVYVLGVYPFVLSFSFIMLGMSILAWIQRRTKSETLPIELLYWFGSIYSVYKAVDFSRTSYNSYVGLAVLSFVVSTVFFLLVKPPKVRSLIFLVIALMLSGVIYFDQIVFPTQHAKEINSKVSQNLNGEPDFSLLAEQPFVGNGFSIRIPREWKWNARYSTGVVTEFFAPPSVGESVYMDVRLEDSKNKSVTTFPVHFENADLKFQFKTLSGLDVQMYISVKHEFNIAEYVGLIYDGAKVYFVHGNFPDTAIDKYTELISASLKTFEITISDKSSSNESQSVNQDSNISKNNCGFSISPPKGWSAIGGGIFRNDTLGSEIRLSCKTDAFEDSRYLAVIPAQKMMMIPDSGFYTTVIEDVTVNNKQAYLLHDSHKVGGVKYFEIMLMVDSGIKDVSKNQMDIIYAYIPDEYRTEYEPVLKEVFYSYKK